MNAAHASADLAGRVAIVAGAAHGIGAASARLFAQAGAAVACLDAEGKAVAEVAAAIVAAGGRSVALTCDVTDPGAVAHGVAATCEAFGAGPQILVYTIAAHDPGGTVVTTPFAQWQRTFDVNVAGAFLLAKAVIPHMQRARRGSIVLTASNFASTATPDRAAYCASKGAIVQLARAIAVDFAADGIRANALSPGAVETRRMVDRFGSLAEAQRIAGPRRPLGRLGTPEEIAAAALFLASDAASFMTGAELAVDGGYNAV